MINKFPLILFGLILSMGVPNLSFSSYGGSDTHTHTSTIELKPASLDGSYKIASVCFLGFGECPQNEDYNVDTAKQCMNEGYIKNNCTSVQEPDTLCPHNSTYVKGCKCKSNLVSCTSPKIGVGPSCGGKYASCTCPSTVSLSYSNDRCTQYCDGNCIAKTCSPSSSESGCSYGTQSCSNGCGGTRTCCKACYPYSDKTGCSYGSYSCSNGCGGTRRCCSSCSPMGSESGCSYGTYSCSDGCGGTRTCCSAKPACTPLSSQSGCQYGTESCSNGCGGTRTCCKPKPSPTPTPSNPCDSVSAVSVPANAYCSSHYSSCSSKCSGWSCNSGYSKSGNSCVKSCASGGSSSCSGQTSPCSSTQTQTSSCKDCSGTTHYTCQNKPDCNVTSKSCSYGCASTNSCGKCTVCNSAPPARTCGGGNGYYSNTPCSSFSGIRCSTNYGPNYLGCTPSQISVGTYCDPDAWRRCCESCNGI